MKIKNLFISSFFSLQSALSYGLFLDAQGHYGVKGECSTHPAEDVLGYGWHKAFHQSFRLLGEVKFHDKGSFFLGFRLFDKPQMAYLGDDSQGIQDPYFPKYEPYTPKVTSAYVRYGFDYLLLEVGRRPRDWGMGLFLDSGKNPFSPSSSFFDGFSVSWNMLEFQNLGFTLGYDKLAETGTALSTDLTSKHGPTVDDDVTQIYASIYFDSKQEGFFSKKVGIYWSNISSSSPDRGGLGVDLNIIDLWLQLGLWNLEIESEVFFRMGTASDVATKSLGGAQYQKDDPKKNQVQSFAGAVNFNYTISQQGTKEAPVGQMESKEFYDLHQAFVTLAYAPGSANGYYEGNDANVGISKREEKTKAIAFHPNFQPALLLFRGHTEAANLDVDGVFSASRVLNSFLWKIGYRYENSDYGRFEGAFLAASLLEKMPMDIKNFYSSKNSKKAGYYGTDLGWELDFSYQYLLTYGVDFCLNLGYLQPGSAFQLSQKKPNSGMLVQTGLTFQF